MLRGTLDDFNPVDLCRFLATAEKSGTLVLVHDDERGRIIFRDGAVRHAESTLHREGFGRKLITWGVLTEAQLQGALDRSATSGITLPEVLIERGLVTEEQLLVAMRREIEDAVFTFFSWRSGKFSFSSGHIADEEFPYSIGVDDLLAAMTRKTQDVDRLHETVPETAVLRLSRAAPSSDESVRITADDWRVLAAIDGRRTTAEVVRRIDADEVAVLRILGRLTSDGLVQVIPAKGGARVIDLTDDPAATPPRASARRG